MKRYETKYFVDRGDWRNWLQENWDKKGEVWLMYPKKASGQPRILYNDAVEEALCFGWIDSIVKSHDELTTIQRFSIRRSESTFSQANKERLKWLAEQEMLHPTVIPQVHAVINETFEFPVEIIEELKASEEAWANYQNFSAPYQRIRIAYINSAKKRPDEYQKRLDNFIAKTKANKMIKGFGGIDKYY